MRNPDRIPEIMNELTEVWEKYPDWRLSQLMMNIVGQYWNQTGHDPFYMEDKEFINWIKENF